MAWWNGGTWLDQYVTVLATNATTELFNATNERIAILNQMDGRSISCISGESPAVGDFPAYADLRGYPLDVWWSGMIVPIRAKIEEICPYFIKTFVPSPALNTRPFVAYADIADLLGSGSYGAAWNTNNRLQETEMWLQIREALERLIWPFGEFDGDTQATGIGRRQYKGSWLTGWKTTLGGAWSASLASGNYWEGFPSWAGSGVFATVASAWPSRYAAQAGVFHQCYCDFAMPYPVLSNTKAFHALGWCLYEESPNFTTLDPGPTISDNHGNSVAPTGWVTPSWSHQWFTMAPCPTVNTQFRLSLPTTIPFTSTPPPTGPPTNETVSYAIGKTLFTTGNLASQMTYG